MSDGFLLPDDKSYRTCSECGANCEPEPTSSDDLGARILFVCPVHGVHGIVDPFDGER